MQGQPFLFRLGGVIFDQHELHDHLAWDMASQSRANQLCHCEGNHALFRPFLTGRTMLTSTVQESLICLSFAQDHPFICRAHAFDLEIAFRGQTKATFVPSQGHRIPSGILPNILLASFHHAILQDQRIQQLCGFRVGILVFVPIAFCYPCNGHLFQFVKAVHTIQFCWVIGLRQLVFDPPNAPNCHGLRDPGDMASQREGVFAISWPTFVKRPTEVSVNRVTVSYLPAWLPKNAMENNQPNHHQGILSITYIGHRLTFLEVSVDIVNLVCANYALHYQQIALSCIGTLLLDVPQISEAIILNQQDLMHEPARSFLCSGHLQFQHPSLHPMNLHTAPHRMRNHHVYHLCPFVQDHCHHFEHVVFFLQCQHLTSNTVQTFKFQGYICTDHLFALSSCHKCQRQFVEDTHVANRWSCTTQEAISPATTRPTHAYAGERVGEAKNPGPGTHMVVNMAITNPTTIGTKLSTYEELIMTEGVDILSASETAATMVTQNTITMGLHRDGYKAMWSPPVPEYRTRVDGNQSTRGKALGVACITHLPARKILGTIPHEWELTPRIMHTLIDLEGLHIQCVTIYGMASGNPNATAHNLELMRVALMATEQIGLPFVIQGDFNLDPMSSSLSAQLRSRGIRDPNDIHQQLYQTEMPFTCKEATRPDTALLCQTTASWVCKIQVIDEPYFDAHKVVPYRMMVPRSAQLIPQYVLPRSWLELPIEHKYFHQLFQLLPAGC